MFNILCLKSLISPISSSILLWLYLIYCILLLLFTILLTCYNLIYSYYFCIYYIRITSGITFTFKPTYVSHLFRKTLKGSFSLPKKSCIATAKIKTNLYGILCSTHNFALCVLLHSCTEMFNVDFITLHLKIFIMYDSFAAFLITISWFLPHVCFFVIYYINV
jgi:hypothetical protein